MTITLIIPDNTEQMMVELCLPRVIGKKKTYEFYENYFHAGGNSGLKEGKVYDLKEMNNGKDNKAFRDSENSEKGI